MSLNVLITGASQGIGFELARSYYAAGARVACLSRRGVAPEGCETFKADISDFEALVQVTEQLQKSFGSFDVIVHNAATLGQNKELTEIDVEAWKSVIDVNLNGTFYVAKVLVPMIKRGGIFAGLSSSVGRKGRARWGAYSASKCGMEGVLDILAGEREDLTVVSLNPGGTATPMRAAAYPDEDPATIPSAEDVADAIFAILGDEELRSGSKLDVRDFLDM